MSNPSNKAPPPVKRIPFSIISAANSGGVFSNTAFTASTIKVTGSCNACRISSVVISTSSGKPVTKFLPFILEVKFLPPLKAEPIVTFNSSAVFSPIIILCLLLTYFMIASSNLSPALFIDDLTTIPPREIIAISHVPPPISTTIDPFGFVISNPAPIAAAKGSSIRLTLFAPEFLAASITALLSTSVACEGMQTITLGATIFFLPTALTINAFNIFSVTS